MDPWRNFWDEMKAQLQGWSESLPSVKEAIGVNLLDSIRGVSDVFASAVMQWDGTARGFFLSVASGFKQLAKQIISELIRMAIQAIVTKIILSFVNGGSVGGGTHGGAGLDLGGATAAGHASGGLITGPGSGTSDSILARVSNGEFVMSAKAVKQFGAGFFAGLNNLSMPRMAFASGGLADFGGAPAPSYIPSAGSRASVASGNVYQFHVTNNFKANENGSFSKQSASEAASRMISMQRRTARRDNENS
jgi:hypothetical protein